MTNQLNSLIPGHFKFWNKVRKIEKGLALTRQSFIEICDIKKVGTQPVAQVLSFCLLLHVATA